MSLLKPALSWRTSSETMPRSWNATFGDTLQWPPLVNLSVLLCPQGECHALFQHNGKLLRVHWVGCKISVRQCSKEEDVAALVDEAVRQYGCLDVMVNNAGRMQQNNHTPLDQIRIQDFDATFKLNVRGTLLGIMHAARCAARHWDAGCASVLHADHVILLQRPAQPSADTGIVQPCWFWDSGVQTSRGVQGHEGAVGARVHHQPGLHQRHARLQL